MTDSTDQPTLPDRAQVEAEVTAWIEANWSTEITVRDWWGRMADQGYTSPTLPVANGGRGWPNNLAAAVAATMAKANVLGPPAGLGLLLAAPTLVDHGDQAQIDRYLRPILDGTEGWCQLFSEPAGGSDLAALRTKAVKDGDDWVINGQKIWTSAAQHADWIFLLARTSKEEKKQLGISFICCEMDRPGVTLKPIITIDGKHALNMVTFEDVRVPADYLIGEEGKGFRYILSGMNAERILIAAECIGDAKWFIDKASGYAKERTLFGRPIGQNQGVQFPIARAYAQMRAAELMVERAANLYQQGVNPGEEANIAKLLAADASWAAADMCVQTHGGFGFAEEYDVERKFRETRLYQVAPISTNMILSYVSEHVLGLPRSY